MKKTFVLAAMLATALVAHAETLKVKIPFAFSATGTAFPAGEYSIATVPNATQVLFIKSTVQGSDAQAFVFGRVVRGEAGKPAKVVFDKSALVGLSSGHTAFELSASAKR